MDQNFKDKTVFVTGAGAGIGYALCLAFARAGAIVALNDIDGSLTQKAAQQINAEVGAEQVYPYGFDVADAAVTQQAIHDFAAKTGRLDIVIANAGVTNYRSFLDYTPEAFDRLIGINLRGAYFTAQAAAKIMIEKKIQGRIILMSSVTGQRAFLNLSVYGITKAGMQHMARSLALELGQYGITANAISPGATLTERTLRDDPAFEQNWATVNLTGRVGYVEDIAAAALFLASPGAGQITGQTITIDGGWSLTGPLPEDHPEIPENSAEIK